MSADPHNIVLIHGMWMTPRSWDNWVEHYGRPRAQRDRARLAGCD